jgi:hypothetical protein
MIRVIVESPFAGKTPEQAERNLRYLRACLRDCLLRGEAPFASHAIYTQPGVLDDNVPAEREHGIQAGFAWRAMADKTVVYVDLGTSRGMEYGVAHAKETRGVFPFTHEIEYRRLGGEWSEAGQ